MLKINSADRWFSLCVRERAENLCERCGSFPEKGGLHNSHYYGRRKQSVRYSGLNCASLCYGCHQYFTSHPEEHRQWFKKKIGEEAFDILTEMANDTSRGKVIKKSLREVAKHYASQLGEMREKRGYGIRGRMEFMDFL